jgi:predicted phage tail protein
LRHVKINFHGFLKKLIPETIEGDFETLRDVVSYLSSRYPQLKAPLDVGRYRMRVEGYNTQESIFCPLFTDELDFYPFNSFSKSSGMGQIIVAAVILVVAIVIDCFGGSGAATTAAVNYLYMTAAVMATLGVLTYFLTPKIKNKGDHNQGDNKYLGTPGNTTASGTPIAIGYGTYKVYGHYLSFNINSSSVVIGTPNE